MRACVNCIIGRLVLKQGLIHKEKKKTKYPCENYEGMKGRWRYNQRVTEPKY